MFPTEEIIYFFKVETDWLDIFRRIQVFEARQDDIFYNVYCIVTFWAPVWEDVYVLNLINYPESFHQQMKIIFLLTLKNNTIKSHQAIVRNASSTECVNF